MSFSREPGNSGYQVNDPTMQKHYRSCVNSLTGEPENCVQELGDSYIECIDNCALEPCADELSQSCLLNGANANINCKENLKWCPQYRLTEATVERGYVPRTFHCRDKYGAFTQEPGAVLRPDGSFGDCLFGNGVTLVNRSLSGDYAYCNGEVCDDTFVGGYRSDEFDIRYRPYYTATKELQRPNWNGPYPFTTVFELGITLSIPMYSTDPNGRKVFKGALCMDYFLKKIRTFLVENFQGQDSTDESVIIFDAAEPHYLLATSTDQRAVKGVLKKDPSQPCPEDVDKISSCDEVQVPITEITGDSLLDPIVRRAFLKQKELDYPKELVGVQATDDPTSAAFLSQSSRFKRGTELDWIVLVISPAARSSTDALTTDDGMFGVVCAIATFGFILCLAMSVSFLQQRTKRSVILSDWRFTSAFLLGCTALNLSGFSFLGENTDGTCLLRMWSFHLLFAVALSPLFVKVWRMYKLVGSRQRNPAVISNPKAAMLTLPIITIQVIILVAFTIADPPKPEKVFTIEGTEATHSVECQQNSPVFTIVVCVFECGLVIAGCVLSYLTRKLDSGIGESKELMFSMYNIAFIGIVIVVIGLLLDVDTVGQAVLGTMGIFWGTVFSAAAFVVPRLMRARNELAAAPMKSSVRPSSKKNSKNASIKKKVGLTTELPNNTGWSVVKPAEDGALGISRVSSNEGSVTKETENHVSFSAHESEFAPQMHNLSEDLSFPVNNISECVEPTLDNLTEVELPGSSDTGLIRVEQPQPRIEQLSPHKDKYPDFVNGETVYNNVSHRDDAGGALILSKETLLYYTPSPDIEDPTPILNLPWTNVSRHIVYADYLIIVDKNNEEYLFEMDAPSDLELIKEEIRMILGQRG